MCVPGLLCRATPHPSDHRPVRRRTAVPSGVHASLCAYQGVLDRAWANPLEGCLEFCGPGALQGNMNRAQLTKWLCQELTRSCRAKAPPLPRDRKPGPEFQAMDSKEAEMQKMLAGMKVTLCTRRHIWDTVPARGGQVDPELAPCVSSTCVHAAGLARHSCVPAQADVQAGGAKAVCVGSWPGRDCCRGPTWTRHK